MAIPTLLRQTDYAGVDFTDEAQGMFEVLRDALVDKFGWALLFEDLTSPNKSFVVANTGSQNCLKITKEDGDIKYLKFEAAQSYSDINTPVNTIQSCYYYVGYAEYFFYIVGDSKRFYFFIYDNEEVDVTGSVDSNSFFAGDVIPFAENNPEVFVLTPSKTSASQFESEKRSRNRGVLSSNEIVISLATGTAPSYLNLFKYDGIAMTIFSPGVLGYLDKYDNLSTVSPCILSDAYLVNKSKDENNTLHIIGRFPGIAYLVTPSTKVSNKNKGELVTIAGQQCITFPHEDYRYYNKGVIVLNDWDVL